MDVQKTSTIEAPVGASWQKQTESLPANIVRNYSCNYCTSYRWCGFEEYTICTWMPFQAKGKQDMGAKIWTVPTAISQQRSIFASSTLRARKCLEYYLERSAVKHLRPAGTSRNAAESRLPQYTRHDTAQFFCLLRLRWSKLVIQRHGFVNVMSIPKFLFYYKSNTDGQMEARRILTIHQCMLVYSEAVAFILQQDRAPEAWKWLKASTSCQLALTPQLRFSGYTSAVFPPFISLSFKVCPSLSEDWVRFLLRGLCWRWIAL